MGFPKQEYWSGLPFPAPGHLPNPGIQPRSPMLQADSLPTEPQGSLHTECPPVMIHILVFPKVIDHDYSYNLIQSQGNQEAQYFFVPEVKKNW